MLKRSLTMTALTGLAAVLLTGTPALAQTALTTVAARPAIALTPVVTVTFRFAPDGSVQPVSNPSEVKGLNFVNGTPVFTIVTTDPSRVTPAMVRETRSFADMYNGVYAGIVTGNGWTVPRIVAAYEDIPSRLR